MKQEMRICLPVYKIVYAGFYVVLLSLIRGITRIEEIGVALDPNIALLAIVFCADTYVCERSGKRWEVFSLYPMKNKRRAVGRRLLVQDVFLCLLSYLGYFFFFWQKPFSLEVSEGISRYLIYAAAVTVTIVFWSVLSVTVSNLGRSAWTGIAGSLGLWLAVNSRFGEKALGRFNLFAYVLQNADPLRDFGWIWGKAAGLILAVLMLGTLPLIMKKRG